LPGFLAGKFMPLLHLSRKASHQVTRERIFIVNDR